MQTLKNGVQQATDPLSAKERGCPTRPGHDIPEALAVVELALGQVALHQVDVLLAGCAGAAERAALRPLRGLRGGIILGHNAQAAQGGAHELLPTPWILQSSCSQCKDSWHSSGADLRG